MLVATGRAFGAVLRYLLTIFSKSLFVSSIYGTFSVNIIGSFTTFSAFSYEVVDLINSKKYITSFTYVFVSIFLCIMFAYLGTLLNKF